MKVETVYTSPAVRGESGSTAFVFAITSSQSMVYLNASSGSIDTNLKFDADFARATARAMIEAADAIERAEAAEAAAKAERVKLEQESSVATAGPVATTEANDPDCF